MPMAYELYRKSRLSTRKPHNQARVRRWRKIGLVCESDRTTVCRPSAGIAGIAGIVYIPRTREKNKIFGMNGNIL